MIHWSADGWGSVADTPTAETGMSVHYVDLPTGHLGDGSTIQFTFRWTETGRWEGTDFAVTLGAAPAGPGGA